MTVGAPGSDAFLGAVRSALGDAALHVDADTLARYGTSRLPGGPRTPLAVVCPASTDDVVALVGLARAHRIGLWPVSAGENIALGERAPMQAGQVVVDMGRRMDRVLEIDETLGFVEIEPGVTFQALYDELRRRGSELMISTTSGPPTGSLLGNALDKGAGHTPSFDQFGSLCGMEIVLGTGEVIRTGDGSYPGAATWHLSRYGYGPVIDGLFAQSNLGIVTRAGLWLQKRPPVIRSFFFAFPDDDDIGEIFERVRPLRQSGQIAMPVKVTSDLYVAGTEETYPFDAMGGHTPISDAARRTIQQKHGIGAWMVGAAIYGATEADVNARIDRIRAHMEAGGKARYIPHEEAVERPMLKAQVDFFSGVPTSHELGLLKWRAREGGKGGGATWYLTTCPMRGADALAMQARSRSILAEHGLEYLAAFGCGPRGARALHLIIFDRTDPEECARVAACYRALSEAHGAVGLPVSRTALDFQQEEMDRRDVVPSVLRRLKAVLDPDGIIAPGRYGV